MYIIILNDYVAMHLKITIIKKRNDDHRGSSEAVSCSFLDQALIYEAMNRHPCYKMAGL